MNVPQLIKKHKLTQVEFIRFQLMWLGVFEDWKVTESLLDTLTTLILTGKIELVIFCKLLTETEMYHAKRTLRSSGKETESKMIFNSTQSARNSITRFIEQGFIVKDGRRIEINPELSVIRDKNFLLNLQLLTIETSKSENTN